MWVEASGTEGRPPSLRPFVCCWRAPMTMSIRATRSRESKFVYNSYTLNCAQRAPLNWWVGAVKECEIGTFHRLNFGSCSFWSPTTSLGPYEVMGNNTIPIKQSNIFATLTCYSSELCNGITSYSGVPFLLLMKVK